MSNFEEICSLSCQQAEYLFVSILPNNLEENNDMIESIVYKQSMFNSMVRYSYNENFSWSLLTTELIYGITEFLKDKSCLSVMSGNGVLEFILSKRYCKIIATDIVPKNNVDNMDAIKNFAYRNVFPSSSGYFIHSECFNVIKCDAIKAVRSYDMEVILISWPNFGDPIGAKTLDFALQVGFKYVIYIGEMDGGCCATDEFFDILRKKTKRIQNIEMLNFWGIHDCCFIYKSTVSVPALKVEFRSPLLNKKIYSFVYHNASLKNRTLKMRVKEYFDVRLDKKHLNFLRTLF
jgi:hypothetical protein